MFSWTTHPTLKSTFTSIRGGNWELTHDQAGIVYLKGWGEDYCEKKEVEQMEEDVELEFCKEGEYWRLDDVGSIIGEIPERIILEA